MRMTSREFNQDLSKAKRESLNAPVIVTDRGKPKHVLLTYAEYQKLTKTAPQSKTLFDWFAKADPAVADIDLEIPKRNAKQRPVIDFD